MDPSTLQHLIVSGTLITLGGLWTYTQTQPPLPKRVLTVEERCRFDCGQAFPYDMHSDKLLECMKLCDAQVTETRKVQREEMCFSNCRSVSSFSSFNSFNSSNQKQFMQCFTQCQDKKT